MKYLKLDYDFGKENSKENKLRVKELKKWKKKNT